MVGISLVVTGIGVALLMSSLVLPHWLMLVVGILMVAFSLGALRLQLRRRD
jgi:hypothetical protein